MFFEGKRELSGGGKPEISRKGDGEKETYFRLVLGRTDAKIVLGWGLVFGSGEEGAADIACGWASLIISIYVETRIPDRS
jgi:hypothetical protein